MKKIALVLSFLCVASVAKAQSSLAVNFETGYTIGSVNGQDGWSSLGSIGSGCAVYDVAVVNNSSNLSAPPSFGTQSLRVSSAATSGCFGDQTFSKSLANEAGEPLASNNGYSGGVRQPHFDAQWEVASYVPGAQQLGLHYSASPDRGDGARMSYIRQEDNAAGEDIFFDDVQGGDFVETQVGVGLDRSVKHTIRLSMDFYPGTSNDVVKVYIDGVLVHTGTSWEDYYAFGSESADGSPSRTVDSVLFRESGDAAPATFGSGYLIDNFSANSGPIPIGPPTDANQCKSNGWKTFNNPVFNNQGACVSYVQTHVHSGGHGQHVAKPR